VFICLAFEKICAFGFYEKASKTKYHMHYIAWKAELDLSASPQS
jgi:hypothetical protein